MCLFFSCFFLAPFFCAKCIVFFSQCIRHLCGCLGILPGYVVGSLGHFCMPCMLGFHICPWSCFLCLASSFWLWKCDSPGVWSAGPCMVVLPGGSILGYLQADVWLSTCLGLPHLFYFWACDLFFGPTVFLTVSFSPCMSSSSMEALFFIASVVSLQDFSWIVSVSLFILG